jgi:soluble lytic murein transglycosylase-like protein
LQGAALAIAATAAIGLVLCPVSAGTAGDTSAPRVETAAIRAAPPAGVGRDGPSVPLPRVLSVADADRYRRIFALQAAGEWAAADAVVARLEDQRLMGHVLAQRYLHPTRYRSAYDELFGWLESYADHPYAPRIHRLARKRRPAGAPPPQRPRGILYGGPEAPAAALSLPPGRPLSRPEQSRRWTLVREIGARIRRGWPTGALQLLQGREAAPLLDAAQYDKIRADIAWGYFIAGKDEAALHLASASVARASEPAAEAAWTSGLAAWRLGRFTEAAPRFAAVAAAPDPTGWRRAAGAYWAARAYRAGGVAALAQRWLAVAAEYPRTFYGLLAGRVLGLETEFDWRLPPVREADFNLLLGSARAKRAFALLQAGETDRAELALRMMVPHASARAWEALLRVALNAGMPALALQLGQRRLAKGLPAPDSALHPVPPWQPQSGFRIDRALIYAIMRQESGFRPHAKSGAGARGLMQLMPRTAKFLAKKEKIRGLKRYLLHDPALNLRLGQRYVGDLLDERGIRGDLFSLAAAYNSGPSKLREWRRQIDYGDDPLLFIEALPSRETRIFVERILSNLWLYRARLGQPSPSLDSLASGQWPTYVPLDGEPVRAASHVSN